MITKPILELIYEAAHIQRWNDHMRPSQGFTELDKQAHKMIFKEAIEGEVIKACDHLAAYVEAYLSVSHGVTSNHLQSVLKSLPLDYKGKKIADIDFGEVYEYLNEKSRL